MIPPRIKDVKVLENYKLQITYINDEVIVYDMVKNLDENYYKKLKNQEYFKRVKSVGTTIEWPDGEDIDPNDLYENGISLK